MELLEDLVISFVFLCVCACILFTASRIEIAWYKAKVKAILRKTKINDEDKQSLFTSFARYWITSHDMNHYCAKQKAHYTAIEIIQDYNTTHPDRYVHIPTNIYINNKEIINEI